MRNKLMLPLLACTLLSMNSCGNKNNDDSVSLDYEKYVLANGLEVVLHHDDSDPVVSVAIQYHVGSNREKPGKTFAHPSSGALFRAFRHSEYPGKSERESAEAFVCDTDESETQSANFVPRSSSSASENISSMISAALCSLFTSPAI